MGRVNSKTLKHNRLIAEVADGYILSEIREREKAARKAEKEASIDYRIEKAQRKCVQNIYPFESAWKKLSKAKIKDEEKINAAYNNILDAIDKAAADSIGRIIAEIKQPIDPKNPKVDLFEVDLPVNVFYSDFKDFCDKELKGYQLDPVSFHNIIDKFVHLNLYSLKTYGERFNYTKPAKQFEKILAYLEKIAVKEAVVTI